MENEEKKSSKTLIIVIVTIIGTLIVVGLMVAIWFGLNYFRDNNQKNNGDTTTKETTQTETKKTVSTPSELPTTAAENFLKSIFSTFPGSSVNLTTANSYLDSSLKSQVDSTKESYWDLHGYIHSGPCSVSVSKISSTDTTAVVEITTEWGEDCMGMAEPYYRYNMSASEGNWVIDSITQLKPQDENTEIIPRDF